MLKVTIDRNTWLRGEGNEDSRLLRESDNKMCCLGFLSLACGLDKKDICGITEPGKLMGDAKNKMIEVGLLARDWLETVEGITFRTEAITIELMTTNDKTNGTDNEESYKLFEAERENEITELFKNLDIEVEFIN